MNWKTAILTASVCLCLIPEARADKRTRGISSIGPEAAVYLEKGQWMVGGSAAWSKHTNSNYKFLFIDDINSRGHSLSICPTVLCGVGKNIAVGGTFFYKRKFLNLASASSSIKDLKIEVTDYYSLGHSFGGRVFFRPYLPIGNSGRVAIFADAGLTLEGGQAKITDRQGKEIYGTYQTSWGMSLNVNPGISAFITRHFAMEASLGIFGIGFTSVRQTHNNIVNGDRQMLGGNFCLNFLALSVGMYYSF